MTDEEWLDAPLTDAELAAIARSGKGPTYCLDCGEEWVDGHICKCLCCSNEWTQDHWCWCPTCDE